MAILCKEEENSSISLTFLFHLQRKYSNALQNSCGNQDWGQESSGIMPDFFSLNSAASQLTLKGV